MIDMEMSDRGIEMLCNFEGFSPLPYEDVAGIETIGFGHKIGPNEQFTKITEEQATQLLKHDIRSAESAVTQCVAVDINQNQYDALVSFTYNLGGGSLLRSTLLIKLNDGDFDGAADEFGKWVHADNKVSPGLVVRRSTERALFLQPITGDDDANQTT